MVSLAIERSSCSIPMARRSPHVRVHVAGSIALGEVSVNGIPSRRQKERSLSDGKIPPPDFEPTLTDDVIDGRPMVMSLHTRRAH